MEKMKKFMVAAVLLSLAVGCTGCGEDSAKKEKEYNVTLITMDQMDVHWVNVNAGVEDAISELEKDGYTINYNWYAPDTKDNAKQIEQIDMAVSNRSDVILIAVNDPNACNQALKEASATKLYYEQIPSLTLQDVTNFEKQNIVGKPYRMVILGNEKDLDMKSLEKIAPIKRLSQEEIFGF